ncbi:hypothetical protein G7K_4529-t1 [Saitoella complicata NRRL Y-17804]|uniref:Uncharacterized protein n=2 Tax=Saitoella complicata (strain BCRC 22490 / CBS 7301 / JCM 7358 / NBRC 10748 / NRRL Y-17804) TaxID=698492 RepID=A0A0E9NKT4_SAICN|nr:hypothetical protein G7K_4529-t1 [Saitoella complicata NRRL Y-17804]
MKFSVIIAAFAAASVTFGIPLVKRAHITDAVILQYALTLEHLEDAFYHQALQNFTEYEFAQDGFDSSFYAQLQSIAADEHAHVEFLTAGLEAAGANATKPCNYSFPYTTPREFVALARVVEGLGVSAYLGAASSIANAQYLTAAGSILTVEARHNAFLNTELFDNPAPTPFDTPLGFSEVYSVAANFITGCPPSNPTLPVTAFPSINVTYANSTTKPLVAGSKVNITTEATTNSSTYAAFLSGLDTELVALPSNGSLTVPKTVAGQVYLLLVNTNNATKINDETVIAGPAILKVEAA